ncbi:MAG: helix-turn-helix domain-containing protein [Candidatus Methylomirabilales bacterium]
MTNLEKLGERVRELRRAKGWSQKKLAHECGMDPGTIYCIENAKRKRRPHPFTLDMLGQKLEEDLLRLL